MYILKLIGKNALRHRLRTALTFLGIVVATIAFGLLQTVVDAWYAGAEGASNARVVTRNAISLIFPLPLTYESKIRAVDGVSAVSYANWFGGVYQEPKNFFPQFAISGKSYLDLYPEFVLPEIQRSAFIRDRKGALVGRKLASEYGFRVGDSIPIKGTIYPGNWEFVIRGIFDARDAKTDTAQMFFHWDYLNETLKRTSPRRANQVGVYIVQINNPDRAAEITRAIDGQFRNSLAETLSETEKAFQLGFVAMTETIVVAIRAVSFVVIIIIMAVMANTMAMTARERLTEYATLKAMGFGTRFLALVIFGESLLISLAAAGVGIVLTFPVAAAFAQRMGTLFPIFQISTRTLWLQLAAALVIGLTAAILPTRRAATVPIVEGLRRG
jgi:putative ABC transport system permease protein